MPGLSMEGANKAWKWKASTKLWYYKSTIIRCLKRFKSSFCWALHSHCTDIAGLAIAVNICVLASSINWV